MTPRRGWLPRVALVLCLAQAVCSQTIDINPFSSLIRDKHNNVRRNVRDAADMQELEWSRRLASQAQKWARKCRYLRPPLSYQVGSNVYAETDKVVSFGEKRRAVRNALSEWSIEEPVYRYTPTCYSSRSCAYAQMIMAKSDSIGCSMSKCNSLVVRGVVYYDVALVVCFYAPPSSLMDQYPYTRGAPCSRCRSSFCNQGLCSGQGDPRRPAELRSTPRPTSPPYVPPSGEDSSDEDEGDASSEESNDISDEDDNDDSDDNSDEDDDEYDDSDEDDDDDDKEDVMSDSEQHFIVGAHNSMRQEKAMPDLSWSNYLADWAEYVIRCDIEYPGPRDTYTNFGKCRMSDALYKIVYDWASEGYDVNVKRETSCRTPRNSKLCNHYTVMMEPDIHRMGCATRVCRSRRQLTCVYDDVLPLFGSGPEIAAYRRGRPTYYDHRRFRHTQRRRQRRRRYHY